MVSREQAASIAIQCGSSSGRIGRSSEPLAVRQRDAARTYSSGYGRSARCAYGLPGCAMPLAVHDDAGVERDHLVGRDEQRVDVQLADLGVVGDQVREPHQGLDQPVEVDAGRPR